MQRTAYELRMSDWISDFVSSDLTVIDRESIERSGAISVETLLQRLPAAAGFAGNQTNAYWASNGYGTTQVNLRGLGINRTLVLLNGRRIVNGGTGANSSVDLNIIPVALIERVEVLKDGASARSEENTSELQSLMRISYAGFCLK